MNLPDVDNYYLARWERERGWDYMNPPEPEEETYHCLVCGCEIDEDEWKQNYGACNECRHQVERGLERLADSMYAPVDTDELHQLVENLWDEVFSIQRERKERG